MGNCVSGSSAGGGGGGGSEGSSGGPMLGLEEELCRAAAESDLHTLRSLLEQGASPNATWGLQGWTVLHHAAAQDQMLAVKMLLVRGLHASVGRARLGEATMSQPGARLTCAAGPCWITQPRLVLSCFSPLPHS